MWIVASVRQTRHLALKKLDRAKHQSTLKRKLSLRDILAEGKSTLG